MSVFFTVSFFWLLIPPHPPIMTIASLNNNGTWCGYPFQGVIPPFLVSCLWKMESNPEIVLVIKVFVSPGFIFGNSEQHKPMPSLVIWMFVGA